jgi:3',5'-cyclic AMP phosphodiesterase CpdA
MAEPVTVAHLSDVHLGPIVGFAPTYWNTKRALGYLNWRRNRADAYSRAVLDRIVADMHAQKPDHILVSGDLINIGLPREMQQARRWLESVGPSAQVSVVPGNHDIYSSIGDDPGVGRWADYMTGDDHRSNVAPTPMFPFVRSVGRLAIIGLNSAVETRPFVAGGKLGQAQRERLAEVLAALGRAGIFRLVMIHHPPLPGQAPGSRGLSDAQELAALLAHHGAELVIHGHNHRNMLAHLPRADGGPSIPVVGVASASMAKPHPHEPLARYNLYRIDLRSRQIALLGRGLKVPDGAVVELEQRQLSATEVQSHAS